MAKKEIPQKILDFLKKQDWPITTEQVTAELEVSWNTAQIHLLKLLADRRIKHKKVGRQNQFWLNRNYKKEMK